MLSPEAIALGATVLESSDLEHVKRWQGPLAKIRVTSGAALVAVKAWARKHNLEVFYPKIDSRERERRKAVTARAIRKKRALPEFETIVVVYAFRTDAWLEKRGDCAG